MSVIQTNLEQINQQIRQAAQAAGRDPKDIMLIGVTKKKSVDAVHQAIAAGCQHFGENYIQEAVEKIDRIDTPSVCWHFIGHLQSNKARIAVACFDYIHTVGSLKLAKEIHRQAARREKIQKILLQINIGKESSKSGIDPEDALDLAKQISRLDHVSIQGLMAIPPYFDDPEQVRPYFAQMAELRTAIKALNVESIHMAHLSMGMSNDFHVAIQEGSTMVRVGTSIFGARV